MIRVVPVTSRLYQGEIVQIPTFPLWEIVILSAFDVLNPIALTLPLKVLFVEIQIANLSHSVAVPLSQIQKLSTQDTAAPSNLFPREIHPFTSNFAHGLIVPIPTFPEEFS